ncbi:hypothetical protein ACFVIZ_22575 [Streptomyces anulatus]|uniref:hypothetical protein n=1 Tax=Streptomyces anulatus TaxID=1892 RepID=UPI0036250A35
MAWKMLNEATATRWVTPLREGGSLPGIVEADDLGTYVIGRLTCILRLHTMCGVGVTGDILTLK